MKRRKISIVIAMAGILVGLLGPSMEALAGVTAPAPSGGVPAPVPAPAVGDPGTPVNSEGSKSAQEDKPWIPSCEHTFEELQISEAGPDHDAVMAMQCKFCGETKDYYEVPNSSYASFQRESAKKILDAAQGGEVVITTDRWISFHHMVTDAMAERPDVEITLKYRYKGLDDTIIIPAFADRVALANDDGYCGFLYLRTIFG